VTTRSLRYVQGIPAAKAASNGLPVPSFGSRLRGIEGLRAVAACSVLVFHSWLYSAPDGRSARASWLTSILPDFAFGVVLFFTLSGFLLYRPFAAAVLRGGELPSIRSYFRNRALRIVPAYLAILLVVSYVLRTALSRADDGSLQTGALDADVLGRSAVLAQNYAPGSTLAGIGPTWSLAIEVVFYLLLPLLALLAWRLARGGSSRRMRRMAVLAPPFLLLAVGISGKLVAAHIYPPVTPYNGWAADWHSVLERSFWCHADLFAFGMALTILRVDAEDGFERWPRALGLLAIPAGVVAYVVTALNTGTDEQLSYSFYNLLIAFGCACLLAAVVLPSRARLRLALVGLLETRTLVWLGLISYSMFLWHEPLVRWLRAHDLTAGGPAGFVVSTALLFALTCAVSTLTYRYVERPALRLKRASRERVPAVPAEQVQAAP
jgi:peptidoglycan/LPS O-acetylase OafA/YrhL